MICFAATGGLYFIFPELAKVFLVIFSILFLVGLRDAFQSRHAVLKNFPVVGHFRYLLEEIRPEIQQYFVESNTDGRPIDRNTRSVVYQRSKKALQTQPYGTQDDVYEAGNEWLTHSMYPTTASEGWDWIQVGGSQCQKPYRCSRLNISAMSYGSLSARAIQALNKGAKIGGFYHNTGEGGISDHHLHGGDLVWQIGTGYFGCRTEDGKFCSKSFAEKAQKDIVKMVEIKLSQGAKPGKGGMLPGAKVTPEVARVRQVPIGKDVLSPSSHNSFSNPKELLAFVDQLRELAGGKPVGIKMCIGRYREFEELVDAMVTEGKHPDFITIDGSEGGTGAAPIEFCDSVGMPLKDSLCFVNDLLNERGLRNKICIIASGKSFTGFDMIRNFALGADIINSARGMMLALGCIQALRCHSNECPVGIATNHPGLEKGLSVEAKAPRVANYHHETLKSAGALLGAMGKKDISEIERRDIFMRMDTGQCLSFEEYYGPVPRMSVGNGVVTQAQSS